MNNIVIYRHTTKKPSDISTIAHLQNDRWRAFLMSKFLFLYISILPEFFQFAEMEKELNATIVTFWKCRIHISQLAVVH